MPLRHAHWGVLLLFPLVAVAFWPGYFGQLREAPLALHLHGISASLWLVLLALQSWSIHARRPALHRSAGLALFAVVPVLAGGSLAAIQGGVALFAAKSDPFHLANSVPLGLCDLVAIVTLVALVRHALVERRHARRHAAAMTATALLVLPPILGRLLPALPGFPHVPVAGLSVFALSFHVAMVVAIAGTLACWSIDRRHGRAFLATGVSLAVQMLCFAVLGKTGAWEAASLALLGVPAPFLFVLGAGAAAVALWQGWRQVPSRPRPIRRRDADGPTMFTPAELLP